MAEGISDDYEIAGMTMDLNIATESSDPPAQMQPTTGLMSCANKDKRCHVCGDKALGYNFSAISCESCKAFFRRNAFKEIKGRCTGSCDVTIESRSYCKRCRLQKCFAVGMKRDLILNDQQKQVRCRKIRENRIRRSGSGCVSSMSPDSFNSTTTSDTDAAEPGQPITHVIAADIDVQRLEKLDLHGRAILSEVLTAFRTTFDQPMVVQPVETPSSVEFLNMADTSVRRLVKMAKQLKMFRGLDQDDQISLLKGAVVEVLILRSSKMFSTGGSGSPGWQVNKEGRQHTVSATSFTTGTPESMAFIVQYQRFVRTLLTSTRNDNVILMILIVITLFSPDRATVRSNTSTVSSSQEMYAGILRDYVNVNYPDEPLMLPRLLQRLVDIRDMNEKHAMMLMNMQVDKLEPLIIEIFDVAC